LHHKAMVGSGSVGIYGFRSIFPTSPIFVQMDSFRIGGDTSNRFTCVLSLVLGRWWRKLCNRFAVG
jgi:hypothetical protein